MDESDLKGKLSVEEFEQENLPNEIQELKEIFSILEFRIVNNNLFKNIETLLVSRYFINNWRITIKEQIVKEIKKGNNLEQLKNQIISALKEIEYRTDLPYTLNIESAILYYYSYSTNDIIKLMATSIDDDIDWVKNLTVESLKNQKIILSPKLKKVRLISLITEIQKGKKNYNEKTDLEIKKFINFIIDKNSISSDYNLSFLRSKDENREFAKIFLLLQSKKLILNKTKDELNQILADCLNISDTTLENFYTIKKLEKELEDKSTSEAYLINELS